MANFGVTEKPFPEQGCALVFGGSGGLGQAISGLMASWGANVAVTYYSKQEAAEQIVGQIEELGRKASLHRCDVTDAADVRRVTEEVASQHGRIHSVISAGGTFFEFAPVPELPAETFRKVIETDVFGFFNIAQTTLPHLRKQGGSVVALITCANGRTVHSDSYSATPKAAVQQLVRQIALEEGVNGIRANAVGPGVIDSGLVVAMKDVAGELLDEIAKNTPIGRQGRAEEIAETVAFLASTKAGYITGQSLHVDGGLTV